MATKPRPTGTPFWTVPCPWCRGTGRHPQQLDGWYVDYHFQDGHEQTGPHTEEAVRIMSESHMGCTKTLVGPDGCVYTLDPDSKEDNK